MATRVTGMNAPSCEETSETVELRVLRLVARSQVRARQGGDLTRHGRAQVFP